ncbi:MAG: thioesterase family protein [Pirellulaceae bacterium]|jgi:predicted thioesterase|nr:thioesterase family protein [Pirellulaceae bacterium]
MKAPPKIGDTAEIEFVVEASHVIDFADAQMPAVLSTPCLIGFLERTARKALTPVLEVGERSVGVHVDVRHLAPTPPGHRVVCTARVIHVEGSVVSFQIEARDDKELIARGLHKRRVILAERFAARLRRKENPK